MKVKIKAKNAGRVEPPKEILDEEYLYSLEDSFEIEEQKKEKERKEKRASKAMRSN